MSDAGLRDLNVSVVLLDPDELAVLEDGRLTDDQARADVIALMAELNELVAVIANPDEEAVAA